MHADAFPHLKRSANPLLSILQTVSMNILRSVLLSAVALASPAGTLLAEPIDPALAAQCSAIFKPIPEGIPTLKGNTVTPPRIELGKMLFFDPRLSKSGAISCSSCHNLSMGGDDNRPTSVGHGGQKGSRNSPTVFNAVFNIAQFWDGRAEDLKAQAKGPIENAVEMANASGVLMTTLKSIPDYVQHFKDAFPEDTDPVTLDNVAKAIECFETTLITPDSRFDKFLKGDASALSARELSGLKLFIGKGCIACHNGVNVGGQAYFRFGVISAPDEKVRPPGDHGRFTITKLEADDYFFRAAPLRNVALTAPYFHSGQVWDLHEAVAIMGRIQLGAALTPEETDDIVGFLGTLTGKPPTIQLPILPAETATTPRPEP